MACYIACKKGFVVDTGFVKVHKGNEYNVFKFTNNVFHATEFENYDAAIQYIVEGSELIGCYAIFQKHEKRQTNCHREMFFLANKYGFIYDTGKQRTYAEGLPKKNVLRTTPNSRLGTSFKTSTDAVNCIQGSLLSDLSYYVLVPIFK